MFVKLLGFTEGGERVSAIAGKLCYSKGGYAKITEKLDDAETEKFIDKVINLGHYSVIEHTSFSFIAEGISRALTHQLVRHRIASYSQKSQRYVNEAGFDYITPHTINSDAKAKDIYDKAAAAIAKAYDELSALGIPKEDARYILPNAAETKIVITMNARELLHFFEKRLCNRAQWEIREMAELMLEEARKACPHIFKNAGPGCVNGACPEGEMTCGKAAEVRKKYKKA